MMATNAILREEQFEARLRGLEDAVYVLDCQSHVEVPDDLRLISGALALNSVRMTGHPGRDILDAWAVLDRLATGGRLNLLKGGRIRAGYFAKVVRKERDSYLDADLFAKYRLGLRPELVSIGVVRTDEGLEYIGKGQKTSVPEYFRAAALVAWTLIERERPQPDGSPIFDQPFVAVVMDRFGADGPAIATLCDVAEIECPVPTSSKEFHRRLSDVIGKYALERFFVRVSNRPIGWRPAGVDWMKPGEPTIRGGFKRWRAHFREASLADQAMVATILWLYRGRRDTTWLTEDALPQPADVVMNALIDEGRAQDWAKLIAYYPGW